MLLDGSRASDIPAATGVSPRKLNLKRLRKNCLRLVMETNGALSGWTLEDHVHPLAPRPINQLASQGESAYFAPRQFASTAKEIMHLKPSTRAAQPAEALSRGERTDNLSMTFLLHLHR